MELMDCRRQLLNQRKRVRVLWNNMDPPFSTELYRPYSSDNTSLEDVGSGIVKQKWLQTTGNNGGYSSTTRIKDMNYSIVKEHIMYLSYYILCSQSETQFSVEYCGGVIPSGIIISPANSWTRLSFLGTAIKSGNYPVYYGNRRGGAAANATNGTYILLKSPLFVDLTLMFGAGKEPTKEEFERQCRLNKIDLESSHEQDISGTQRLWYL